MESRRKTLRTSLEAEFARGPAGAAAFVATIAEFQPKSKALPEDLFADLEFLCRDLLGQLLRASDESDRVSDLLRFTVEVALLEGRAANEAKLPVPPTGKLPFLLFEDLVESTVLQNPPGAPQRWSARRAWDLLEQSREPLTGVPALFNKGKLVLLRLCNGLVRRLSKSQDTEWCGRVLMFLTAAYPLSERSAVNVKGEANILNVTDFESAEDASLPDADEPAGPAEPAEEGEAMDVDPKSPAKAGKTTTTALATTNGRSGKKPVSANYALYQSMWGLQRYMVQPNLALTSAAEMNQLFEYVEAVVSAFEFHRFAPHELEQGRDALLAKRKADIAHGTATLTTDAGAAGADSEQSFFGCKYLTTSRLLPLQLVDPQLRAHLVTQLFILASHLRAAAAATALADPTPNDPRRPSALEPALAGIEKRLGGLLDETPPNGAEYLGMLTHVLEREVAWKSWKSAKCAAYERFPAKAAAHAAADEGRSSPSLSGRPIKKRRRNEPSQASLVESLKQKPINLDTETIGGKLAVPQLKDHMERYVEAEDPENGIEEAYHPKHEKLYCWQATRLIMTQQPGWLVENAPDLSNAAIKLGAPKKEPAEALASAPSATKNP